LPDLRPLATEVRALLLALLFLLAVRPAAAQELDCRVTVNYATLSGTDFGFLADLAEQIEVYLNQRSWTEDRFQDLERIACTFAVTITEAEGLDRFRARLAVGGLRPIWGTPSRSTVFQILDSNWQFTYNRGQALVFDLNRFDSLTSVLDFYAFLILGYDYDSFDELGGTPFFEQARRVADLAQAQSVLDWQSVGEDQTRATLVRQLLDNRFQRLRRAYFLYHFGGLDRFTVDPRAAWEASSSALDAVYELYLETSRRYAIDVFFAAKSTEIPDLFAEFPERVALYGMLVDMDPGRASAYDRLTR
jgi:hypothetical protein